MRSTCSSCHAPIMWAISISTGKKMPLDPDPVDDGNVVMIDRDAKDTPRVRVLKKAEMDAGSWVGLRYNSHFATCIDAPDHRRRK